MHVTTQEGVVRAQDLNGHPALGAATGVTVFYINQFCADNGNMQFTAVHSRRQSRAPCRLRLKQPLSQARFH